MTGAAGLAGDFAAKPHPRRAARGVKRGSPWADRLLEVCAEDCGESGAATAADVRGVAVREVAGQHLQLRNLVMGVMSNLG
jgi:hypothetical protein